MLASKYTSPPRAKEGGGPRQGLRLLRRRARERGRGGFGGRSTDEVKKEEAAFYRPLSYTILLLHYGLIPLSLFPLSYRRRPSFLRPFPWPNNAPLPPSLSLCSAEPSSFPSRQPETKGGRRRPRCKKHAAKNPLPKEGGEADEGRGGGKESPASSSSSLSSFLSQRGFPALRTLLASSFPSPLLMYI